jgi:FtsP/CotA-like multicopper oxidase with cupredoxin domain
MVRCNRLRRTRYSAVAVGIALLLGVECAHAWATAGSKPLPRIEANRNLSPGGQLRDGIFTIRLEIREGDWFPEAETGPSVAVQAFAEEGRGLQIPGPLIRVPEGTEVRATVRNTLAKGTARLYGLHGRPGGDKKPLEIPAGESRDVRFKLTAPGTYHYWATTTDVPLARRFFADTQLSGALIVDPPGEVVADRVFVIGVWLDMGVRGPSPRNGQSIAVINGKAWPHTERLTYTAGEPVRWRWINGSYDAHPMHLHGAYFRVRSQGDGDVDVALPDDKQWLAATERIPPGSTRSIALLLEREGRWLFHCHMLMHMSAEYRHLEPIVPGAGLRPAVAVHHANDDSSGMTGLVLGLTVLPGTRSPSPAASTVPARKLTLLARERPATDRIPAATVFQLQEGSQAPPLEAATVPGPALVLKQGEPVEITVVNQLREPTAVHWHGIEIDSYHDGVPGWGGSGAQVTPPVEPGRSFVARFTPPRAGTFIYHTHWHNFLQLTGGLYGPLLVLRPDQKFDPETDIPLVIGIGGALDLKSPVLLNGNAQPEPLRLKAGVKYRLRFINITTNGNGLEVSLLGGSSPARWRAVAKDGEDLPPAQAIEREAQLTIGVGETYDFEFAPTTKGDLRLEVVRPFNRTWTVVEVQVR